MIDFNTVFFLSFLVALGILITIYRKRIKVEGPIFIFRTLEAKRFIERVGKKYAKFWNFIGTIAVVIGVIVSIITSFLLIKNAYLISIGTGGQGAALILPAPVSGAHLQYGILWFPFQLWIIIIPLLIIPHEFFHGFISAANKIKIKSLGLILFLFIPGAFVEPDEKKLKTSKLMTQLRIYAAGSFANLLVAGMILLIVSVFHPYFYSPLGLGYQGNLKGYPAAQVNLSGIIEEINGVKITSVQTMRSVLSNISPNTTITIKTSTGTFNLSTVANKNLTGSFIGIAGPFSTAYKIKSEFVIFKPIIDGINLVLKWGFLFSIFIAMVNLLPMKPLDGGLMLEAILKKYVKDDGKIVNFVSILFLFILVFNIIGPYVMRII
ncbi:MAG: site-2 protease family protein [Candidatus Aenigmarchaeota archaeon]|nr:site-2 protease family protein [Candidatus Aenigmarchaeota archaeon]